MDKKYDLLLTMFAFFAFGLIALPMVDLIMGYYPSTASFSANFWHYLFLGFRFIFWAISIIYIYRIIKIWKSEKIKKPMPLGNLKY